MWKTNGFPFGTCSNHGFSTSCGPAIGENPYPFSLGLGRWLENAWNHLFPWILSLHDQHLLSSKYIQIPWPICRLIMVGGMIHIVTAISAWYPQLLDNVGEFPHLGLLYISRPFTPIFWLVEWNPHQCSFQLDLPCLVSPFIGRWEEEQRKPPYLRYKKMLKL